MNKNNLIWIIGLIAIPGLMFVLNKDKPKDKPMGGTPLIEKQMIIEKGKDLWVVEYMQDGLGTREFITEDRYKEYLEKGLPEKDGVDEVKLYQTAEFTEKEPVLSDYEFVITDKATTTGKAKVKLPDKEAKEVDINLVKDKVLTDELINAVK